MQIKATSVPKYRDGKKDGDDVLLILPGSVFAVFDGATDARGTIVDGTPAGRLAALTVATATAETMLRPANRSLPASEIFALLSKALRLRTENANCTIPPSTTLALALDCGAHWRFVILGDSGIRLNGVEVLQPTKVIDRVATEARLALYAHFRDRLGAQPVDAIEQATRRAIFLGLERCTAEGHISAPLVTEIIRQAALSTGLEAHLATVEAFLLGGICSQQIFANSGDTIFGFDTMNGTSPCLGQWIDETRSKADIQSIELFTDGYPSPPDKVDLESWEAEFARMEDQDFHMLGPYSAIKGGMSSEHHDDRSVIVMRDLSG